MRRLPELLVLMLAAAMAAGCSSRSKDALSERETVDLITDLRLADAYSVTGPDCRTDSSRRALRESVMRKHGVSEEKYIATLDYYGHHTDEYYDMLGKVENRIASLQTAAGGASEEEGATADKFVNWPYGEMLWFSKLGYSSPLRFTAAPQTAEKGRVVTWTFRLNKIIAADLMLGAEYSDGSVGWRAYELHGNKRAEIKFQTDSNKEVRQIFGQFSLQESYSSLPLWIDSVRLSSRPLDRDTYRQINQQRLHCPKKSAPVR